jgi:DNA gyrase/topoisomerase IV subunit B
MEHAEHIYKKPDTYTGSCENEQYFNYILQSNADGKHSITQKTITWTPAFYKCFDELLVNAYDHKKRMDKVMETAKDGHYPVSIIKVNINDDQSISFYNDGDGIQIEYMEEHKMYPPELIFGSLLTSTNYDDNEQREWGGRNGYGAKLANIFSKRFEIETICHINQKKFKQEFTDNMANRTKAKITSNTSKPYTRITWLPDYKRFSMPNGLTDDIKSLIARRVYDIAGVTDKSTKVFFNDKAVEIKTFDKYVELYLPPDTKPICEEVEGWFIAATSSSDDTFEQVSFVNGIHTVRGGTHVEYVADQIKTKLVDFIKKKRKVDIKPQIIKNQLKLFVNATKIVNPVFDSQTKETLKTPKSKFGKVLIDISDKFITNLSKTDIIEKIINQANFKDNQLLTKTDGAKKKKVKVDKLCDANKAGSNESKKCTLILTEGDSAKTMAISGLAEVGRDYYGVYPLRGKILNVRDASVTQIVNCAVLKDIKEILGLQSGAKYDLSTVEKEWPLRYGRVLLMTDQDQDGSHIKGLIMNVFDSMWQTLLKLGFICSMATPIVKAFKGNDIQTFYTLQDYEKWKQQVDTNRWRIKYYKGLGTSSTQEAKEYFRNLKIITYEPELASIPENDEDDVKSNSGGSGKDDDIKSFAIQVENRLDLAFNKKRADDRKSWLRGYNRNIYPDYSVSSLTFNKFVDEELIHFSNEDNDRSIPSIMDGLKPSQRKVLFACFKRNLKQEIKVAQLAGYVSENASYHHGEVSLEHCIKNMAQDFVGSNNINLLMPIGQFGCLSPDTPIIMWDGSTKRADEIKQGDKLIGDDGSDRTVLNITEGEDEMYKIDVEDGNTYTVNSQHILTLYFKNNNKIYWKESSGSYRLRYFNGTKIKEVAIGCNQRKTKLDNHFNKSTITKEEAYNKILKIQNDNIELYKSCDTIDIKLVDYLKLSKTNKEDLYMISNTACIDWEYKEVPIDPYILGIWLGDGKHDGSGYTSIDEELIKEFVLYADTINCEMMHHTSHNNNENYTYGIRRKSSGYKVSIGDIDHNEEMCTGCLTSNVKSPICNFHFEKAPYIEQYGHTSNGQYRNDLNPFKEILKKNNLFKNKHIPQSYLINDRNTRLQLLAGFIDTDGTLKTLNNNGQISQRYEISQSKRLHSNLIYELEFLCKSLGFATTISEYRTNEKTKKGEDKTMLTILIAGSNIHEIPTKLARKKAQDKRKIRVLCYNNYKRFSINPLGINKFNGWMIDKNERFLLGNFIVTHNSRISGGQDAAQSRYIFTCLNNITRSLYNKDDDQLCDYLNDDGFPIEPKYYYPILPMIAINGASGIGTGFSTEVPCHNPLDISKYIRSKIMGQSTDNLPINVWYRGFKGRIRPHNNGYITEGIFEWISDSTIRVSELPVGKWTEDYIEFLEKATVERGKDDDKQFVKSYQDNSTESIVDITVKCDEDFLYRWRNKSNKDGVNELLSRLKLTTTLSVSNIHTFDENCKIKKWASIKELVDYWYECRKVIYVKRHQYLLDILRKDLEVISWKVKFILEIVENKLEIRNKKKADINKLLQERGYPKLLNDTYDYLLTMDLYKLTYEEVEELKKKRDAKQVEHDALMNKKPTDLWIEDLDGFDKTYNEALIEYDKEHSSNIPKTKKKKTTK